MRTPPTSSASVIGSWPSRGLPTVSTTPAQRVEPSARSTAAIEVDPMTSRSTTAEMPSASATQRPRLPRRSPVSSQPAPTTAATRMRLAPSGRLAVSAPVAAPAASHPLRGTAVFLADRHEVFELLEGGGTHDLPRTEVLDGTER